ncbi:MAG: HEAT repeat domain-containing protein [Planctomycetes bacterium]|nr:HEAT repeat domain-containing protein [Planctomycetota bacterium]
MIALLLALSVALAPLEDKPAPPDPARVKAAVAELEKAFKSSTKDEKLKAIQKQSEIVDADVAKALGKGLADKEVDVQRSTIEALRWMDHPTAVEELHAAARTRKELRKEPPLFAALLRAIGQHGSPKSVEVLTDDVWTVVETSVIEARILGLGQIRTNQAVEALMDLMKVAGPQRIQNVMPYFRLALARLTGVDKGQSQQMWQDWWSDNKGKFKVAATPPELPRELQFRWDTYWGKEPPYERLKKRGERGQGDPEK